MHKAVAYHKQGATGNNIASSTLIGPGTWSSVGFPSSSYVYNPKHELPITAESRPDPSWTSHDYACFHHARTGSYPTGNAFIRESATRFEDRAQSQATTSDGDEDDMGRDGDEDDGTERRRPRVNYDSEDDRYDRGGIYQRQGSQDSVDDAETSDGSESNFAVDRPRAAMSDVRNRHPQTSNPRVKEYSPRLTRAAPPASRTVYNSDITSRLPPSVRIVRASASIISSRTSEPESSQYDDEYTPNSASTSTSPFYDTAPATSYYRPSRPLRANPSPKRKFSTESSDDEGSGPAKAPRLPKGGHPEKKGKRQYKCEICPNFFAGSKGDLKRHSESLVHKPPSYVCEMPPCDKKFTRLDALKRHMKNAHAPGRQTVKVFKNGHPKAPKGATGSK